MMDALTLIAGLALVAGALLLILYPLWQQTRPEAVFQVDQAGQTLAEYQARYQAALTAIKDLMFDYEMGKVSAEDYENLLNKIKVEAAGIRHQIDRLSHLTNTQIEAALDVEIEALIAQMKHKQFHGRETLLREVDAEIELLKTIELERVEADELACPQCGKVSQVGDTFCAGCGQPLVEPASSEPAAELDICPACGYAFQPDDRFCAKCGSALEEMRIRGREEARI